MAIYFTYEGLDKHKARISELEGKLRSIESETQEICENGGDGWHDNASYEHLKEDMRVLDKRISKAYKVLNEARILEYPSEVSSVHYGSEVEFEVDGVLKSFQIVGYGEGDVSAGKVVYNAPIAQALIGKKAGEAFEEEVNGVPRDLKVLDVKPIKKKII